MKPQYLMDRWKAVYAQKTDKRVLADVIPGADIFLGLSAPERAEAGHGQADGGKAIGDGAWPIPIPRSCG